MHTYSLPVLSEVFTFYSFSTVIIQGCCILTGPLQVKRFNINDLCNNLYQQISNCVQTGGTKGEAGTRLGRQTANQRQPVLLSSASSDTVASRVKKQLLSLTEAIDRDAAALNIEASDSSGCIDHDGGNLRVTGNIGAVKAELHFIND